MELEVKGNKFYMLVKKGKDREIKLYNEMKAPIGTIKGYLKKGTNAEDIELLSIELKEEKFEIKTIPWSILAVELVKTS